MIRNKLVFTAAAILLLPWTAPVVGQLSVFYDDFDGGQVVTPPIASGFSGFTNTEPVQGFAGLGTGTNVVSGLFLHNPTGDNFTSTPSEKTTLSLSGLPPHSSFRLKFLLAVIDTWDGNSGDYFRVDVDGVNVFAETFTNSGAFSQSYVAPTGVLIDSNADRGFEIYWDSLYNLGLDTARFGSIPHSGDTLQIDFYTNGPSWNRPANESWAIDNLEVVLLGVPEPGTVSLAGFMLICVGCRPRRRGGKRRKSRR